MATARISYQTATLDSARECALLGAHQRTIARITGLAPTFISRFVFDKNNRAPRGRPRYEDDYIFRAPLRFRAEACAVALRYAELVGSGFAPARALITAYRHQAASSDALMMGFDEAFFLIARLHGLWSVSTRTLQLIQCERCGCWHIVAVGPYEMRGCRFCKLLAGARSGAGDGSGAGRLRSSPNRANRRGHVASEFANQIDALRFERWLQEIGAHKRVVSALMSTFPDAPASLQRIAPTELVRKYQALPLHHWSVKVPTLKRAGYSLIAKHFLDLLERGFVAEHAIVAAFDHTNRLCPARLSFDRCFEVVSLLAARWGVTERALSLRCCRRCGSLFLFSSKEVSGAHCPFCTLQRRPEHYFGPAANAATPDSVIFSGAIPS